LDEIFLNISTFDMRLIDLLNHNQNMYQHLVLLLYSMYVYDVYYYDDHLKVHLNLMLLIMLNQLTMEPMKNLSNIENLLEKFTPPSFFDRPIKPVHVSAPQRQWNIVSPRNSDSTPYSNVNSSPKNSIFISHYWFHIKYLPASIARVANKPTRKSPLIFHFSVRKFGSQLWFAKRDKLPRGPASITLEDFFHRLIEFFLCSFFLFYRSLSRTRK
jgi:hypothetical protein